MPSEDNSPSADDRWLVFNGTYFPVLFTTSNTFCGSLLGITDALVVVFFRESINSSVVCGLISSLYAPRCNMALTGIFPVVSLSIISYSPAAPVTSVKAQRVANPCALTSVTKLVSDASTVMYWPWNDLTLVPVHVNVAHECFCALPIKLELLYMHSWPKFSDVSGSKS